MKLQENGVQIKHVQTDSKGFLITKTHQNGTRGTWNASETLANSSLGGSDPMNPNELLPGCWFVSGVDMRGVCQLTMLG